MPVDEIEFSPWTSLNREFVYSYSRYKLHPSYLISLALRHKADPGIAVDQEAFCSIYPPMRGTLNDALDTRLNRRISSIVSGCPE